jgi:hypothetical protein
VLPVPSLTPVAAAALRSDLHVLRCLLQVEVLEQVFRLLRSVPRFSRQAGSSSGMLGAGGTLTDDVVLFNAERAKWRQQ